ncbi:DUF4429 domain-containing protein [Streptomyces sp. NPDC059740]|uniref:DUF4429 domain-containing protein n=1 Tax=Streptomyces sp. NPDC059740 TaxID=3346926 RepID=UPI00364DA6B5
MGDVLTGVNAVWTLDSDSVRIRYARGLRRPKLHQVLGERRIPFEALRDVELSTGRRGTVVLRAEPRPGADPLTDVAGGQLREASDPHRLVLPAEREDAARAFLEQVLAHLGPDAQAPADHHMVAAPDSPLQFKAYDGKASFDGSAVSFRWFWTGASSAKWTRGDQVFPVTSLSDVEWRSPEIFTGHLRLIERGAEDGRSGTAGRADQDPAAVVFGPGYGMVHESLPFAAAVLQAVRAAGRARGGEDGDGVATAPCRTRTAPAHQTRSDAADIADRIRQLGELHEAGLLTDDEFSTKKAELLAQL